MVRTPNSASVKEKAVDALIDTVGVRMDVVFVPGPSRDAYRGHGAGLGLGL